MFQINQVRREHGLKGLKRNELLVESANAKACDLKNGDYFSHTDLKGRSFGQWVLDAGYDYVYAGENLARGFSNDSDILKAWLKSSSHREIILSEKYTEIGVGRCDDYVAAHFGKRGTYLWSFVTESLSYLFALES